MTRKEMYSSAMHYRLLALLLLLILALAGCASTEPVSEESDDSQDDFVSTGIAAVAGENADWENTISSDEMDDKPFIPAEKLMNGQIAGVEVHDKPGGGITVKIRGASSILGSTEPLYVVDGMPVLLQSEGLSWLNTKDIKKIEVIKDIDARALYGTRGANGVVIITTKLGND